MKTLVELGVEPCVGMIIQSPTHGKLLHHITEIETERHYVWVKSINERGTYAKNLFDHIKNNWFLLDIVNYVTKICLIVMMLIMIK